MRCPSDLHADATAGLPGRRIAPGLRLPAGRFGWLTALAPPTKSSITPPAGHSSGAFILQFFG
jgi:hypothetical protein